MQYGAKPGLERIFRLTELLGRPQHDFASIHIGGTNGKGSTSLMLSRILTASGYKTGMFVSPHLHSYRERMQINGVMISTADLAFCLSRVDELLPILAAEGFSHPTEFEVLTAAAFLYFSQQQVEVAVIEVGMGGLYDSTNVINPLVSVITNIEMDHTAFLGHTIAEIAVNKAGIIKPRIPVVTGETKPEALKVLAAGAREKGAELLVAPELVGIETRTGNIKGQELLVNYHGDQSQVDLGLPGTYQRENLAVVWVALDCLQQQGLVLSLTAVKQALKDCRWPGRLELISEDPMIILDAGHNEAGAKALQTAINELLPDRGIIVVAGILDDKDARAFIANMPTNTRAVVITHPDSPRADNWRQKADLAREYFEQVYEVELIEQAVNLGLSLTRPEEALLVTGSFYVLDRARKHLLKIVQ
ncbi:MAG: bifunctional folylpolyglutamate synthase/dihydrofolate synthase [Methylocystaceae bacterium]